MTYWNLHKKFELPMTNVHRDLMFQSWVFLIGGELNNCSALDTQAARGDSLLCFSKVFSTASTFTILAPYAPRILLGSTRILLLQNKIVLALTLSVKKNL